MSRLPNVVMQIQMITRTKVQSARCLLAKLKGRYGIRAATYTSSFYGKSEFSNCHEFSPANGLFTMYNGIDLMDQIRNPGLENGSGLLKLR